MHNQLSGDARRIYDDFEASVQHIGMPGAVAGISALDKAVFGIWNDPEKLASFAREGPEAAGRNFSTVGGNSLADNPAKVKLFQEVARARLHALSKGDVTPSPVTANDLGMSERRAISQQLREGATFEEALNHAIALDAQDGDKDVQGPLESGELDLGIRKAGDLDPTEIQPTARQEARELGLNAGISQDIQEQQAQEEAENVDVPAADAGKKPSSLGFPTDQLHLVLFAVLAGLIVAIITERS
jgi:hypothetical protein